MTKMKRNKFKSELLGKLDSLHSNNTQEYWKLVEESKKFQCFDKTDPADNTLN